MTAQDHYEMLGIQVTGDATVIKRAYRVKALILHPDKNGGTKKATDDFQKLQAAYECLSDPIKKAAYDLNRKHSPPKPSTTNAGTSSSTNNSSGSTYSGYGSWSTNSGYTSEKVADLLAEQVKLASKWREHDTQGKNIKTLITSRKGVKADLERQMEIVKKEMEERNRIYLAKTAPRSWLQRMVWGDAVLKQAEIDDKTAKDQESLQKMSSLRIKIAGVDRELKDLEKTEKEWAKKEATRLQEEQELHVKIRRARLAEEVERKRKAEEAARQAEEKAKQAREKAEREYQERIRKAREEVEKRQREWYEEYQRTLKEEREQREREEKKAREEAERRRKEAEQRQKEQAASAARRRQHTSRPTKQQNSPSAHSCSHQKFWNRINVVSETCSRCSRNYKSFIFQCPGCQTRACASCRDELKGRPRKNPSSNSRNTRHTKSKSYETGYAYEYTSPSSHEYEYGNDYAYDEWYD